VARCHSSYPTRRPPIDPKNVLQWGQDFQRAAAEQARLPRAVDPGSPTDTDLLQDLQHGNFPTTRCWMPLPATYASVFVPPGRSIPIAGSAPATQSTGSTSTMSTTSSVTAGTWFTSAAASGNCTTQQREQNPTQDPDFMSLSLRPRLGNCSGCIGCPTTLPAMRACVSWWAKGGDSLCSRRATHQPFDTPAERERLLLHIRNHLLTTTTGSAST
jgi:hypothetical protein